MCVCATKRVLMFSLAVLTNPLGWNDRGSASLRACADVRMHEELLAQCQSKTRFPSSGFKRRFSESGDACSPFSAGRMDWEMWGMIEADCCPEQLLTGAMCFPPRPISAWLHSKTKNLLISHYICMKGFLYINVWRMCLFLNSQTIIDI